MRKPVDSEDNRVGLMNVREVAQYLRLSEAKVYRMAKAGQIPAIKIGRAWRFKRELIDDWIKEGSERRQLQAAIPT
jgi:excisionase family DNA binding protein